MIGWAIAVVFIAAFLFAWQAFKVELTYRISPELGDEIVIALGSLANPDTVREQFAISPEVDGDLAAFRDSLEAFTFYGGEQLEPHVY